MNNVEVYSKEHQLQERDFKELIQLLQTHLNGKVLVEKMVMDIGCGPGNNSTRILKKYFSNAEKIVGIDCLEGMICEARNLSAHANVNYQVANIEDRVSMQEWIGKITLAVSNHTFHWLHNQEYGFNNLYRILKPEGMAALIFVLDTANLEVVLETKLDHTWGEIVQDIDPYIPASHYQKLRAPYYRRLLEGIGFEVLVCEESNKIFSYETDEDFTNFIMSINPYFSHIQENMKQAFVEYTFARELEKYGRDESGKACCRYTILTLILKKPF